MKKTMNYKDHIQKLKTKKEQLPFHKMDDVSRRQFIQSVGTFLTALAVPSMIRLETMSKLSRKIFGSSLAYAANSYSSGNFVIEMKLRAGFNMRWPFGIYGDDAGTIAGNANMPWNTGVTSTAVGNKNVILSPAGQKLAPFAQGIQYVQGRSSGGHVNNFSTTWVAGLGETTALRAASEIEAGSQTLLPTPFAFGDKNQVAVNSLPPTLQTYSPLVFNTISDAVNTFKPIDMKTNEGTMLSQKVKDDLLGVIGNQFSNDIMAGLKDKDRDAMEAANEQSLNILKEGFNQQLDPNNSANAAIMNVLRSGLSKTNVSFSVGGADAAEAAFVLIQAANLGITPMNGAILAGTGDWHNFNALPSGTFTGDRRYATGKYIADLIANICTAASSGMWQNRDTGDTQHVTVVMASEFSRRLLVVNGDDGDGETDSVVSVSSNVNQNDFVAGTFGGSDSAGKQVGYSVSSNSHSTSIPMFTTQELLGHRLNILGIDKEKFGLKTYAGISGLIS